ncbi:hypothetical protein [Rhodospirillum sp. A1_3_36]|uniref:hypothetical protein n=1 Tax=Rhodospirillum sp. A1_3_36 TaxID=3391666 RepID=UPI0039A71066
MLTIRLLFGAGLAALFAAGSALVGVPIGPVTGLCSLGLFVLPCLVAKILGDTKTLLPSETLAERMGAQITDSFTATGAALLGRDGRPYVFSSISQAKRCARRHLNEYGIIACEGHYFLTDRHLTDREAVRTHIRSTYALDPGATGLPVLHLNGSALEAPRAILPVDRLLETRDAMVHAAPLDRLTRKLIMQGRHMDHMETA